MTEKEREELEYRKKLDGLIRTDEKIRNANMTAIANHHVDLLCDFYNLQIEPNIEPSILYPDLVEISKSTKRLLNQRDLRRIKRFLRKVIQEDTISFFENEIQNTKWHVERNVIEREILEQDFSDLEWYRNRERAEWLPDDKWKAWRKSSDFREFVTHYLMTRRTIDDLLQNRFHIQSKKWLEDLEYQLSPPANSILKRYKYEPTGGISARVSPPEQDNPYQNGYYELKHFKFRWKHDRPVSIDWCGLDIKFLGESVLDGIYQILTGATQVRQCALDNCEKIARFPASGRGGRNKIYCSRNCTQKASNRRSEKK